MVDEVADAKPDPNEVFHEAVRVYLESQDYADGLLVDWILVTSQHMIPDDGGSATSLAIMVSRDQPLYRTVGLAQYAITKTQQRLING